MKFIMKLTIIVTGVAINILTAAPKAHAYLDPGTGSYILQLCLAAAMGGLFIIKMFWKNIITFIKDLLGGSNGKSSTS